MRARSGWLAALAAIGGTAFAPSALAAAGAPVELVSPQAAVPLAAGSTAVLEWAALPSLDRLPASEEWEAFLSLDGGKTYTFRITPHLDRGLRRTLWAVPDVPSADARLLLRFGDERRETVVELPQRFTIAAAAVGFTPPPLLAAARGEAARPGEPGVVSWVEGSRHGTSRRQVATDAAALSGGGGWPPPALSPGVPAAAAVAPAPVRLTPPRRAAPRATAAPLDAADPPRSTSPPADLLLQTARRNE
jgi:hypothetical protein